MFAAGLDSKDIARFLCDICTDVELQGTLPQTELVARAKTEILETGSLRTLDALAQNILDDLRKELKLARAERKASVFAYAPREWDSLQRGSEEGRPIAIDGS